MAKKPLIFTALFSLLIITLSFSQARGSKLLQGIRIPAAAPDAIYNEMEGMETSVGSNEEDDNKGSEPKSLIYTADYQGVKTHPSPLPKHPKP